MAAIMSAVAFDSPALKRLLRDMGVTLQAHSEEIRELDAKVGDGDLGITVGLMGNALAEFAETADEADVGKLLMQCGLAVNRSNPSTFGTLLASGFMAGGKAVMGKTSVGLADWVEMGAGAVDGIQNRGKASVGDKTMLDALAPAVAELSAEARKGSDERAAARAAARAAEQGMKATIAMVAKCGRARAFQERSVGVQDGGATAIFYLVKAFADFVDKESQSTG